MALGTALSETLASLSAWRDALARVGVEDGLREVLTASHCDRCSEIRLKMEVVKELLKAKACSSVGEVVVERQMMSREAAWRVRRTRYFYSDKRAGGLR